MALLGYESLSQKPGIGPELVFQPPEIPQSQVAEWLRKFSRQTEEALAQELALEALRATTLRSKGTINKYTKKILALWDEVYDAVHSIILEKKL